MWLHQHPYPPFIPKGTSRLIVGTLPPPRFSVQDLKPDDVDFCYGSRDGMLWKILDSIYELDLDFKNTPLAISQRKMFLNKEKIGICDIVESAFREKIDATDLGMQQATLRDLLHYLEKNATVNYLIFTGGNSKNGPEYFFRKQLKQKGLSLECINANVPRKHAFEWCNRRIETVSLTAPSGSANRAIGSMESYKKIKNENPHFTTFDFRVAQYREVFKNCN